MYQLKHHAAIGSVVNNFTHLENMMQSLLWRAMGVDNKVGRCVTQHMSFNAVHDAILTILHEYNHFSQAYPLVKDTLSVCNGLRIERNKVVHASWGIIAGEGAPRVVDAGKGEVTGLIIKARGQLQSKIICTTIGEISALAEKINAVQSLIAQHSKQVSDLLNARNAH